MLHQQSPQRQRRHTTSIHRYKGWRVRVVRVVLWCVLNADCSPTTLQPESSPHDGTTELQSGPKRCMLSCTLCGRNFDYVSRYLVTPQPASSHSSDLADGVTHHMKSN
jgi:hypothetical protein